MRKLFLIESIQHQTYTELVLFSRDKDGKKVIERVKDFKPYFYVLENEPIPDTHSITSVETGHVGIYGEKLKKIFVKKSTDVQEVKLQFSKSFESDVAFPQRYIIDKIGEVTPYPLRILYLDIETDSDDEFPNLEKANQAVTCITVLDSFINKPITFFYESPNAKKKATPKEGIEIYNTEETMLMAFLAYVYKYDPDILTGWYCDKFDLPYLIRRMELLNLPYKKLSPMRSIRIDERYGDAKIKGRVVSDMMRNYRHFRRISNQGNPEAYSLEFTGQEVLGCGKLKLEKNFHTLWLENPDKLIEYNMRDVVLVKDIDEELGLLDFFNQIRCKACSQFDKIYFATNLIDGLLMRRLHNKIVLPDKSENDEGKTFSGAYVLLPKPGVYDNIFCFDVKSMYPNIIRTFNMGVETFNPNGEIHIDDNIGFNKGCGILAEALIDLDLDRQYWKKKKKDAKNNSNRKGAHYKQYALKVLANSMYGYIGYPKSRLYKVEVADAVTTMGRRIIKWTQSFLTNKGYEVIYGDTDSVYVQTTPGSILEKVNEASGLVKELNESYINFTNRFNGNDNTLEIEFEMLIKAILFVPKKEDLNKDPDKIRGAKKKYAYIPLWVDGELVDEIIKYKGFATVRSDSPRLSRDTQKIVIDKILHGEQKKDIITYLRDLDSKIRKKEISYDKIAFPGAITKPLSDYGNDKKSVDGTKRKTGMPPVITGAKYSNKYLGTRFGEGMKPKWVYVKAVPLGYPDTKYITFIENIPKGFIPDYDKINNRLFKMKLETVFHAVGWLNFPEINTTINKLDKWGF